MLEEPHHPFVVDRVEERADIGVEHPVHPFLMDADPESIQRLMLASPFTEPVRKAKEVRLIDGVQYRRHGVLDDFVLQRGNAERPEFAVRFGNIDSTGWQRAVAAGLDHIPERGYSLVELFLVVAPCHPVDAGRRGSLQLPEAFRQQFGRHVVHQRREPCLPVLLASSRIASNLVDALVRLCVRGAGECSLLPLAAPLPSRPSASGRVEPPRLFGSFTGTMRASDFSSLPTLGLWRSPFPSAPRGCSPSGDDETSQFPCEGFPRMLRVSDRVEPLRGCDMRRPRCCLPLRITASALQTSDFAAQWLACGFPCQRFGDVLADAS